MTVTEILDALQERLANRNRERDDDMVDLWMAWLRTHAEMLEDSEDDDD